MRQVGHEVKRIFFLAVVILAVTKERLLPRETVVYRPNILAVADRQALRTYDTVRVYPTTETAER